jgi:hypothetical protein
LQVIMAPTWEVLPPGAFPPFVQEGEGTR